AVPTHYFDKSDPYWVEYAPEGYHASEAIQWFYALGSTAGWPALGNYMLAMMPVARTSPMLAAVGLSYEEATGFHKLAGAMALIFVSLHGIFCQLPLLDVSWQVYVVNMWDPTMQPGQWDFAGQVAWILQVVMTVLALQYFRRKHYRLFRISHAVLFPLVIIFTVIHIWDGFWYFMPGMTLYMVDVAQRTTTNCHYTTAALTAVSDDVVILRVAAPWGPGSATARGITGRFVYLCLPSLSRLEWHPMSIARGDADGSLLFVVKVWRLFP
ncbi:unnamed protein product, partial [Phaeothamnion confervicola]